MKSRSQRLSSAAHGLVTAQLEKTDTKNGDYKTRAKSFPALILQSGLANAVGFALAKKEERGYGAYLKDLATLLGQSTTATLHATVIGADLATYRGLTRRALEASTYLKRCAEILIENDDDDGENDQNNDEDTQP